MCVSRKALLAAMVLSAGAGRLLAQGREQLPAPPGRYIDGVIAQVAGRIILYSDLAGRMQQARQNGEAVTDTMACNELDDLLFQQLLLEQAALTAWCRTRPR